MKRTLMLVMILTVVAIASTAIAVPGCPESAANLDAFKKCLVPRGDGQGMNYRGTAADMNDENGTAALMNAMHSRGVVAPTPVIRGANYYPTTAWGPMMAVAAQQAAANGGQTAFMTYWTMRNIYGYRNPYIPY